MNVLKHKLMLRIVILYLSFSAPGICAENINDAPADNTVSLWRSPKMLSIEKQYNLLWEHDRVKQRTNPAAGKDIYSETHQACQQLFKANFSYRDLLQLADSCEELPMLFCDRQSGFNADVLEFMVKNFVAMGDRCALVDLLSKRFVGSIGGIQRIEYYLACKENSPGNFFGERVKDQILILGEAYKKSPFCQVREEIAAAVRLAFGGQGIRGQDNSEFVSNAMEWYQKEKNLLGVNYRYLHNDVLPLYFTKAGISDKNASDTPTDRQPLFETKTSRNMGITYLCVAVLLVWLIYVVIATSLSVPILVLGRKKIRWRLWELLALILPFAVWIILMISPLSAGRKSLMNLIEIGLLALAVPAMAILRVTLSSRVPQPALAGMLIAILCVVAVMVFWSMPPLLIVN